MKIESKTLFTLLASVLFIAACGQTGPLYLPGQSSTIESMMPEQRPATDAETQEDDEEEDDNIN